MRLLGREKYAECADVGSRTAYRKAISLCGSAAYHPTLPGLTGISSLAEMFLPLQKVLGSNPDISKLNDVWPML